MIVGWLVDWLVDWLVGREGEGEVVVFRQLWFGMSDCEEEDTRAWMVWEVGM